MKLTPIYVSSTNSIAAAAQFTGDPYAAMGVTDPASTSAAQATLGNFQKMIWCINNNQLNSDNYASAGFLSNHFSDSGLYRSLVASSQINSNLIQDDGIADRNINYNLASSGARAIRYGNSNYKELADSRQLKLQCYVVTWTRATSNNNHAGSVTFAYGAVGGVMGNAAGIDSSRRPTVVGWNQSLTAAASSNFPTDGCLHNVGFEFSTGIIGTIKYGVMGAGAVSSAVMSVWLLEPCTV